MVYERVNIFVVQLATSKNLENIAEGFSEPKKRLLYYLKVMQHAGLEELLKL